MESTTCEGLARGSTSAAKAISAPPRTTDTHDAGVGRCARMRQQVEGCSSWHPTILILILHPDCVLDLDSCLPPPSRAILIACRSACKCHVIAKSSVVLLERQFINDLPSGIATTTRDRVKVFLDIVEECTFAHPKYHSQSGSYSL